MAILSDYRILEEIKRGNIIIKPFHRECLGTNSYDVHLGNILSRYKDAVIDAKKENPIESFEIPEEGFELKSSELYLASTIEYTETHGFIPFLDGKSSTGRLGLSIHETAGKGDAGFKGHWTLEIRAGHHLKIYVGMPIAQIYFHTIDGKVTVSYDKKESAKYSNQGSNPVGSRMWMNFGKDPFWK